MKVGTDSDLLGALAAEGSLILDIGTGTGVLSLMMAQRCATACITAVEIDDNAIIDAQHNFTNSRYDKRLSLVHASFQDYLATAVPASFDSIVCNPPYFDRSLECPDQGRTRARHSSSLPFEVLIQGASTLLQDGGYFSVCIPPEVLDIFNSTCQANGLNLQESFNIHTVPNRPAKRYVQIYRKGGVAELHNHDVCMRNADRTRSDWYLALMDDFLLCGAL